MTKRILTALVALTATLCFHPIARAADTAEPAQPVAGIRERLQQMASELKLTDAQREKMQGIARERLAKLRDLRQDASLSQAEKTENLKALRDEIIAEFQKVLTPEQLEQWKAKQGRLLGAVQRPFEQLQESIKQLNLTDEQKEKLKSLYLEQMGKLRELRGDAGLSMQAKLEKLQAMRKDITPEMKKVLDSAQFEKWQKSMDRWLENLKQRVQGQAKQ